MRKKYEAPKLEMIRLEGARVIAASDPGLNTDLPGDDYNENQFAPEWWLLMD